MCKPSTTYKIINPSSYIILDGQCIKGCLTNTISYNYKVYYSNEALKLSDSRINWNSLININETLILGIDQLKFIF